MASTHKQTLTAAPPHPNLPPVLGGLPWLQPNDTLPIASVGATIELVMDTEIRTPFLERLLLAHPELNQLPIEPPVFDEWQGGRLIVPSPAGSDVFGGLFIEDL